MNIFFNPRNHDQIGPIHDSGRPISILDSIHSLTTTKYVPNRFMSSHNYYKLPHLHSGVRYTHMVVLSVSVLSHIPSSSLLSTLSPIYLEKVFLSPSHKTVHIRNLCHLKLLRNFMSNESWNLLFIITK